MFALRFFVWLHNKAYQFLSYLACLRNGGLHPKHALMNYHAFFTERVSPSDTVLDLGCGIGANAYDVAAKAKRVVGIDYSPSAIKTAKRTYQRDNLEFLCGDATTTRFPYRFDKIILSNVLEHIADRVPFLKSLHALSSVILLRVPLITRDWLALYKRNLGFEYRLDPTHTIEYDVPTLEQELTDAGWRLESSQIQFGELWGIVTRHSVRLPDRGSR